MTTCASSAKHQPSNETHVEFYTHSVQVEQTLQYDCHASTPPCHGSAHCLVGHVCTPAADTQRLVGLEASRHVIAVFSQLPSWENWLGRCRWLRDLSRRSCRKDPDLGSLVGKSAIRTQHMVSWVPFGYLSVIVGLSMDGRLISKSTTLASLSHENCKRATKFVNLALADTENPTVFSALQGAPLQRL